MDKIFMNSVWLEGMNLLSGLKLDVSDFVVHLLYFFVIVR